MSSKDEHIAALEDEVRAARETIKALTKAIEELSKNRGDTHIHKTVIDRYTYPTYPYWWDGRTWYYQTPTYTLTTGSGTTTNTFTFDNKPDDDDGIQVSNVS